jgi:hypothetical protein
MQTVKGKNKQTIEKNQFNWLFPCGMSEFLYLVAFLYLKNTCPYLES